MNNAPPPFFKRGYIFSISFVTRILWCGNHIYTWWLFLASYKGNRCNTVSWTIIDVQYHSLSQEEVGTHIYLYLFFFACCCCWSPHSPTFPPLSYIYSSFFFYLYLLLLLQANLLRIWWIMWCKHRNDVQSSHTHTHHHHLSLSHTAGGGEVTSSLSLSLYPSFFLMKRLGSKVSLCIIVSHLS